MAQLFSHASDTRLRAALAVVPLIGCAVLAGMWTLARSVYVTGKDVALEQPVAFSHQHHVSDVGIDCRYCHRSVETNAHAGLPATQICINCHSQLWRDSDMLAPVRTSYSENLPLQWIRVHDLADYVYFNHSIHVAKGIGCYECHGRVGDMPLTRQAHTLTMGWCLECHRNPAAHVRPVELVYDPRPLAELVDGGTDITKLRSELAQRYKLHRLTDCYTCHR